MLLSTLFDQLTHGELSGLSIGGNYNSNDGSIVIEDYSAIIAHINLGLTELHKVFPLKIGEAIVQQYAAINIYHLTKEYAVNGGSSQPTKYIIDTVTEPFENNILKIEHVYDERGAEIVLNDLQDLTSVLTPTYNSIQVPNPIDTETLSVTYRADHPTISPLNLDPTTIEINIPMSLLDSLLYYIAHRAYASVSVLDGIDQSANYYVKFNASIAKIKKLNLLSLEEQPNQKLWNNGWV